MWGYDLKLTQGHIFVGPKEGILAMLDRFFSEEQARGMVVKSPNVLTHDDIYKLYHSKHLFKGTPTAYQCHLIFTLAVLTAMRPIELYKLNISQLTEMKQSDTFVCKISGRMGSIDGTAKNCRGGFKDVKIKNKEIYIFDEHLTDGQLNAFRHIEEYLDMRSEVSMKTDNNNRFFAGTNSKANEQDKFFKAQPLGEHTPRKSVQNASAENGIFGLGDRKGMVTHGLRGTVATLLLPMSLFR